MTITCLEHQDAPAHPNLLRAVALDNAPSHDPNHGGTGGSPLEHARYASESVKEPINGLYDAHLHKNNIWPSSGAETNKLKELENRIPVHFELPDLARTPGRFSMIYDDLVHVTGGAIPFSRRMLLTSESLIQIQTAFAGNGRGRGL